MIVVDASVAVKWTIEENDRDFAMPLTDRDDLAAPDVLFAELAHVFRRKIKADQATLEQCVAGLRLTGQRLATVFPSSGLADQALGLAVRLDHSAYDCLYLAAALANGTLVTADEVFVGKCRAAGYGDIVGPLRPGSTTA